MEPWKGSLVQWDELGYGKDTGTGPLRSNPSSIQWSSPYELMNLLNNLGKMAMITDSAFQGSCEDNPGHNPRSCEGNPRVFS